MTTQFPIESLLSARRLLSPQLIDDYVYFLSDLSDRMNLYRMHSEGGIPEPLLPASIALQNPQLMTGESFVVFPDLGEILVMIDNDGDENYQPCSVPLEGGVPEPLFGEKFAGQQLSCRYFDRDKNIVYFSRDDRQSPNVECFRTDLRSLEVTSLGASRYKNFCVGTNRDHSKVILLDIYTAGDSILYLWTDKTQRRELLFGVPIEEREPNKTYPPSGIFRCNFTDEGCILFRTTLFKDNGSLAWLSMKDPGDVKPVSVKGVRHRGQGELESVRKSHDDYLLWYNIDGCSWVYEGRFANTGTPTFTIEHVIVGEKPASNGVVLGIEPWAFSSKRRRLKGYAYAFTQAITPSQLYSYDSRKPKPKRTVALSSERILGIDKRYLSDGEDASYNSSDGFRISARLYLPSRALRVDAPHPLVLYVHGGPQSQERPNFTWFSMPLIQHLTLNGFAVFVPNVRGSTGYGSRFMKMVDHDWGGRDAQDHVEGLKMLERDRRIDSSRRGVIGRSYGGYMTLTLVSRFPDLWKAGVDMFGPYNLFTFMERLPKSWTSIRLSIGDPVKDHDFIADRSPSTHFDKVRCPMLMIQGRNDPRVVERETRDAVERLRARGLSVDYLLFEDEGHDVIKLKNRILCYNQITRFFTKHLESTPSV